MILTFRVESSIWLRFFLFKIALGWRWALRDKNTHSLEITIG